MKNLWKISKCVRDEQSECKERRKGERKKSKKELSEFHHFIIVHTKQILIIDVSKKF